MIQREMLRAVGPPDKVQRLTEVKPRPIGRDRPAYALRGLLARLAQCNRQRVGLQRRFAIAPIPLRLAAGPLSPERRYCGWHITTRSGPSPSANQPFATIWSRVALSVM